MRSFIPWPLVLAMAMRAYLEKFRMYGNVRDANRTLNPLPMLNDELPR
jgi:hypothetical protein